MFAVLLVLAFVAGPLIVVLAGTFELARPKTWRTGAVAPYFFYRTEFRLSANAVGLFFGDLA